MLNFYSQFPIVGNPVPEDLRLLYLSVERFDGLNVERFDGLRIEQKILVCHVCEGRLSDISLKKSVEKGEEFGMGVNGFS